MSAKMEVRQEPRLTELQRDPARFTLLAKSIKDIGRQWVAKAMGYNEQSVTNYVRLRWGSERLENALIQNLGKAIEMKHNHERQQAQVAYEELTKNLSRIGKDFSTQPEEGGRIDTKKPSANPQTALSAL